MNNKGPQEKTTNIFKKNTFAKHIFVSFGRETLCGNSREYYVCCENFEDEEPKVDTSDPCQSKLIRRIHAKVS